MRRTEQAQGLRLMKFGEVYARTTGRLLSQAEAAEVPGVSERTFRRWRDRYEVDGAEGLRDDLPLLCLAPPTAPATNQPPAPRARLLLNIRHQRSCPLSRKWTLPRCPLPDRPACPISPHPNRRPTPEAYVAAGSCAFSCRSGARRRTREAADRRLRGCGGVLRRDVERRAGSHPAGTVRLPPG